MGLIKQYLPTPNVTDTITIKGPCRIAISIREEDVMKDMAKDYSNKFSFQITQEDIESNPIYIGKTGRYDFAYTLSSVDSIKFTRTPYNTIFMVAYD